MFSSCSFGLHLWVRVHNLLPALSCGMQISHCHLHLFLWILPFQSLSSSPNHFVCQCLVQSFWYWLLQAVGEFTCKVLACLHLCLYKKNPFLQYCLQWIVLTYNKLPIVNILPISCHVVPPLIVECVTSTQPVTSAFLVNKYFQGYFPFLIFLVLWWLWK